MYSPSWPAASKTSSFGGIASSSRRQTSNTSRFTFFHRFIHRACLISFHRLDSSLRWDTSHPRRNTPPATPGPKDGVNQAVTLAHSVARVADPLLGVVRRHQGNSPHRYSG